jgi:mannose-6-phosphate isomerase-like protein (cupin superfamily)
LADDNRTTLLYRKKRRIVLSHFALRRVVTGLNAEGKSCVVLDGVPPSPMSVSQVGTSGFSLWQTHGPRASNQGNEDAAAKPFDIAMEAGASKFIAVCFPPVADAANLSYAERKVRSRSAVSAARRTKHDHPGMHATNTVDYVVILSGELTLVLEEGETVLRAGDVLIDRGVAHAWENCGLEPVIFIAALVDAEPLASIVTGEV